MFDPTGVRVGRLWPLVEHLPADSATVAKVTGTVPGAWPRNEQLLALVLESLDVGHRIQAKLWSKSTTKLGEPLRIDWPGRGEAEKPRRRPSTKAEIARFLGMGSVRVIDGGRDDGS